MRQKSRQGGRPVYWTSASMFLPVGKRRPISHKFTVLAETPRSAAICFNRRLFRCRHVLKTMAKFLRISHPDPDFPATGKYQHNGGVKESVKTTGPGRLRRVFAANAPKRSHRPSQRRRCSVPASGRGERRSFVFRRRHRPHDTNHGIKSQSRSLTTDGHGWTRILG